MSRERQDKELLWRTDFPETHGRSPNLKYLREGSYTTGIELCGIQFTDQHDQDCCERVYADWDVLEGYHRQLERFVPEQLTGVTGIEVRNVRDMGFIVFLYSLDGRLGTLVNCYNEQNGYYGSRLTLRIEDGAEVVEVDVDKEDWID